MFSQGDRQQILRHFAGENGGKFDDPELREIAAQKHKICKALGHLEGLTIADVGSGTGVLLPLLSQAAGEKGKVFAIELSEVFLGHLKNKKDEMKLSNVEVKRCDEKSTHLPTNSAHLALLCDVYHHVEFPYTFMSDVRRALRDDGRLYIVDFYNDPQRAKYHTPEWCQNHIRADKATFRGEIERAGFRYLCDVVIEGLDENYMMVFEKKA
eukprot:CAMPEP_0197538928 /NCGR_PEP_ID=MMETSP1318-20131121/61083_1 /TAXON_ID=552666 /ORGANISM="Partenskyella glossopodia, Strain RCC365" /LENGTH=210 /DNA_ID=CAMNT_0043097483 /DNA_START=15 /DNA_END=647 /DNA_ORIENTATION=+